MWHPASFLAPHCKFANMLLLFTCLPLSDNVPALQRLMLDQAATAYMGGKGAPAPKPPPSVGTA